ncbi:hypothetical protein ACFO4E_01880 [Nocardiopsis mangrovi]|uniref:Transferase n=1 Tax=Nocardiopsis mangrovi TaxID=1179818 RepID=A0ABV9DQ83_9ACTN
MALFLAVSAAVWFTEGGLRGSLVGSLLLALMLLTDTAAERLRAGRTPDSLDTWLRAVFARLREYTVYAGVAIGGALSGVPDAWAWAAGALISLALFDTVVAARAAAGAAPPGTATPRGRAAGSPIDAVDPGRRDRTPSDPSLTAELFGTPVPEPRAAGPGAGDRVDPIRIRTVPESRISAEWEEGRLRAIRSVRAGREQERAADEAPRPAADRGRAGAPAPSWVRTALSFPQAGRLAVVASTITIWDARVTFIALIVGCAVAITRELTEQPARDAAR